MPDGDYILDNQVLTRLKVYSTGANFLDILEYKLIRDRNDCCEIQKNIKYNGYVHDYYNVEKNTKLLVTEENYEKMKKEIYLFSLISFHDLNNIDGIVDFSDIYQLLEYSDKLKEEGKYHYIKYFNSIVPTICVSKDHFEIEHLNRLYNQECVTFVEEQPSKQKVITKREMF